jgi:NADH dehydrogenase
MTELAKKICILGGGFGGLYTALRLNELSWEEQQKPEIILVDQNDRFLFSPLLYELITEEMQTWEIAPPYSELLADTEIKFIQDRITNVDLVTHQIHLANHSPLHYDRLAIALGGSTPTDLVKGAKEYAIAFRTLEDAYKLKNKLRTLENSPQDKIRVVIVGGGYSGVELAVKIADRLGNRGKIRIVERGSQILKQSPEFNRKTAQKALEERQIWLDLETEIEEIEKDSISLCYKGKIDKIPVDLVLWTVGTKSIKLIDNLSLPQNEQGKLPTNKMLQVENHPEIFAVGDLAQCYDREGKLLPANAQVAFQQADYCAWNIWASLENKPLLPFQFQPLGEMLALGTDHATISGLGFNLDGNSAYLARRLIYLYRLPTLKHKLSVGLNWLLSPVLSLF